MKLYIIIMKNLIHGLVLKTSETLCQPYTHAGMDGGGGNSTRESERGTELCVPRGTERDGRRRGEREEQSGGGREKPVGKSYLL